MFNYILFLILNIVFLLNLTLIAGIIPLIERKYLSLVQRRVGPNFTGYKGRLQFIADALKLFFKGIIIPFNTNYYAFIFIPSAVLSICYLFWVNMLWSNNFIFLELEYNLLYLSLLSLFFELFIVFTGFINKNKYSFISSIRTIVMLFSVELLAIFFILLIVLTSKSLSFSQILIMSENYLYFFALIFVINMILIFYYLETSRAPFDINEAESELITGFHVEYSSFLFGLYYLAEYFHLFFFSLLMGLFIF